MDSKDFFSYSEAMINITEDEQERLELAARIAEALSEVPRGTKSAIALKCSINPAAVTGWLKTGRINQPASAGFFLQSRPHFCGFFVPVDKYLSAT